MLKSKHFIIEMKINENCIYDGLNKKLIIDRKYYSLSKNEIVLLELLLLNKDHLVTKEMIKKSSFLFKENTDYMVRAIIYKIRNKIGKDFIITIPKLGYKINNIFLSY